MLDDTSIFMLSIFAIGLFLLIVSSKIDSDLDNCISSNTKQKDMRRANKGLLVISITFMCLSFSYLYQRINSCVCPKISPISIFGVKEFYTMFFIVLGIVLLSLGSTIKTNDSKVCVLTNSSGAVNSIVYVGVILILGCGGYLGMTIYNNQKLGKLPSSNM